MLHHVLFLSSHLLLLLVLLPGGLVQLILLLPLELVDGMLVQLHVPSYPLLLLVLLLEDHLELVLLLEVMLLSPHTQGPSYSRCMRSSENRLCPGYS